MPAPAVRDASSLDVQEPVALPPDAAEAGIGIVGAGTIVRDGHLPAYRRAGLRVVGVYDLDQSRARQVAAVGEVDTFPTLEALAADHRVSVIDLAVPPAAQPALVERLVSFGKPLLCQ
jgi:predicted dehydrogenase